MTRLLIAVVLLSTFAAAGDCLSINDASQKIGDIACVKGTVLKVAQSRAGHFFLDFCKNYRQCPFTVFVPAKNLRDVGDVRQLEGKTIEIHGRIKAYNGHAEIVLTDLHQLKGDAGKIPPMPKEFDVSRKGRFSPGNFEGAQPTRAPRSQPQSRPITQPW